MSQMAAEAPPAAPAPARRAGGGNVFTRKIGPLPMWVWLLIGVALIGVYVVWKRNQASQAQPTANASQVPQFVNQVYTSGVPPTVQPPVPGPQPHKCPKGQAWDADEGKCVPEGKVRRKRRHKGRGAPDTEPVSGSSVTTINPGPIPIDPGRLSGSGATFATYIPPAG